VVDSNDLTNRLIEQQYEFNLPSYYEDRYIRTTKFPRIGRSLADSEEISSLSEENSDEKRSVLFPRIGKRAFHNLLWANSRSNPHRMLDSQGRHYINGYDYHINPIPSKAMSRYRTKRNLPM
jgi:hypothetical protein